MSMSERQSTTPKPKRRWLQYSLRTLLVVMLLASIGMSWFAVKMERAKLQRAAVEAILNSGGSVAYEYECDQRGNRIRRAPPRAPWLRRWFGDDFFADVVLVDLGFEVIGYPDNRASDDPVLRHFEDLLRLQYLDLSNTIITDAALEHLKGLAQLRRLVLQGTDIADAALEHLKRLSELQELNLKGTKITDAGLEQLARLPRLRHLNAKGTRVAREGTDKLQRALPNCKIER